jgi:hypothetical protein
MTQLTILEATKFCGKDRKTLYNAIKSGKLSATKSTSGVLQIEVTELIRIYGESSTKHVERDSIETVSIPQVETTISTNNEAVLRMEIESLKLRLEDKERHIEDLRSMVQRIEYSKPKKPWWKF